MRKPLLFISHRLPYPPHNGAAIRTLNILKQLSLEYDVHAICYERPDGALASSSMPSRVQALGEFADVEVFPIPQLHSRARLVADHARSLVSGKPYTWYLHDVPSALTAIGRSIRERSPSVIHVDSLDLVRVLPELPLGRTVVTHHNIESDLLRLRGARVGNKLKGRYLAHQSDLLRRAETFWSPRVALNIAVSDADADKLRQLVPTARIAVIPNGVDIDDFAPSPLEHDGSVVFVGGTSWYPNLDGLEWFVAEILPRLRARGIQAPIKWLGRATQAERLKFSHDGLELTGYVDDIRPFVHRANCFIAPLRVGGGTRLKLLDAWAMGKAVVTTTIGAEGLGASDRENCLIADDADAFAGAISEMLASDGLVAKLGAAARSRAVGHFAWDRLGEQISALYRAL